MQHHSDIQLFDNRGRPLDLDGAALMAAGCSQEEATRGLIALNAARAERDAVKEHADARRAAADAIDAYDKIENEMRVAIPKPTFVEIHRAAMAAYKKEGR